MMRAVEVKEESMGNNQEVEAGPAVAFSDCKMRRKNRALVYTELVQNFTDH